ncbi:MAG: fasciclin domain-containing protein [Phycisphaerales bacterium]|nr:MAG: fasciclin domain-containing protein [Phycisphaerales bacterium]
MFAKVNKATWLLSATLVAVVGLTGLSLAQEKKSEPPKPMTIVDVARQTGDLKTLYVLLESAGLVDTLKSDGPYTLFAPTDKAFAGLGEQLAELQKPQNTADLQRLLRHHVLQGSKAVADLKNLKSAKTMTGEEIVFTVKGDVVMIDGAKVIKADVKADNGLIHVIDTVLTTEE